MKRNTVIHYYIHCFWCYTFSGGFPMPQPYTPGYPAQGGGQTGGGSYPQQSGFQGYPNYPQSGFGSSGFQGYPSQPPGYSSSPGGYPATSTVGGGYPNYTGGGGVQSESSVYFIYHLIFS